jgi:hypothetical protein
MRSSTGETGKGLTLVQKTGAVASAVAAVAGAIAAVIALTGSNDGAKPAPEATFLVQRFEPLVSLGEFARRFPDYAPADLPSEQADRPGGALFLDLTFRNFEGRRCALTWTMYDEANDRPLTRSEFVDHPAGEFELGSAFEHFTPPVWIPAPTRVEDVYVLFQLADDAGPCGSTFRSETMSVE